MERLRKCPFCGGRPFLDSYKVNNQIRYFIHCTNKTYCPVRPCTGASPLKIEVEGWWNGGKPLDEEAKNF